jgi:hypothetical protein
MRGDLRCTIIEGFLRGPIIKCGFIILDCWEDIVAQEYEIIKYILK